MEQDASSAPKKRDIFNNEAKEKRRKESFLPRRKEKEGL